MFLGAVADAAGTENAGGQHRSAEVIVRPEAGQGDGVLRLANRTTSWANLVVDGATLQLGIGTIPDAVLHYLTGFKDIGVHTEMFSDRVIDLVEGGVVTNRRESLCLPILDKLGWLPAAGAVVCGAFLFGESFEAGDVRHIEFLLYGFNFSTQFERQFVR